MLMPLKGDGKGSLLIKKNLKNYHCSLKLTKISIPISSLLVKN